MRLGSIPVDRYMGPDWQGYASAQRQLTLTLCGQAARSSPSCAESSTDNSASRCSNSEVGNNRRWHRIGKVAVINEQTALREEERQPIAPTPTRRTRLQLRVDGSRCYPPLMMSGACPLSVVCGERTRWAAGVAGMRVRSSLW